MKFNFILMNPPYSSNLHISILDVARNNFSNVCVNLSPVRWLQDPLAEYKQGTDWKKFGGVREQISSLDVILAADANEHFDIGGAVDLGIYKLSETGGFDCKSLHDPIIQKVLDSGLYGVPFVKYNKSEHKLPYFVIKNFACVHPERKNGRFLTCILKNPKLYGIFIDDKFNGKTPCQIMEDDVHVTQGKLDEIRIVEFPKEKIKNLYDFLQLDFVGYCVMKVTIDPPVHPQFTPYVENVINPRTGKKGYESDWIDEDLCKIYNITDVEWNKMQKDVKENKNEED